MDKLEQHSEVLPAMQGICSADGGVVEKSGYQQLVRPVADRHPHVATPCSTRCALSPTRSSKNATAARMTLESLSCLIITNSIPSTTRPVSRQLPIDLDYYANHIANYCMNGTLSTQAYLLSNALQKMQPVRASHHNEGIIPEFTVGITWMPAEYYNKNDFVIEDANGQQYEYADYAVLYPMLKFYRKQAGAISVSTSSNLKSENP